MQQGRMTRPWTGWPEIQAALTRRRSGGAVRVDVDVHVSIKIGASIDVVAGHALDAGVLVVLRPGLVLEDLAVELVDQGVDGGVQVFGDAGHMHILATQAQRYFGALAFLFFREVINGEDDCDIDDVIEMSPDAL